MFASGGRSEDFHSSRMTCLSSSLSNHFLSNLNFFYFFVGFVRISARTGRWSDPHNLMYFTAEWGKFLCLSSFPTALSSRHLTTVLPARFHTHDNIFPENGNSSISQPLNICLNGRNELSGRYQGVVCPLFSLCSVISLKSPIINQGLFRVIEKRVRRFQTWCLCSNTRSQ